MRDRTGDAKGACVNIVCLDLEGVLIPEIWIEFSKLARIAELARTTCDEPDYDKLMRGRLDILARNKLGLPDIQRVIDGMRPFPGARSSSCVARPLSSRDPV